MRALDRALATVLPVVPRPLVRLVAARYIAGERLDDAVRTVRALAGSGRAATVDVLGEASHGRDEVAATAAEYRRALAALAAAELPSGISVKPSALGLRVDAGLLRTSVEELCREAAASGRFVRIDMEGSDTVDPTLALYRELRAAGVDNVGVVLQARLRRTLDDVRALAELRPSVRLCKGIYLEPPAVAHQEPQRVRDAYLEALELLLAVGSRVGLATHDEQLLRATVPMVQRAGQPVEVQMLLGVREERARRLVAEGHRVRVYVPYGVRWYEYSLRRLQENPGMAAQIAGDTATHLLRYAGRLARGH